MLAAVGGPAGWVLVIIGAIVALPKGRLGMRSAQVVGLTVGVGLVVSGIVLVAL